MYIDPHVHCRDKDQSYKETISHALSVAERAGFSAIFDIPNLTKPVTDRRLTEERLGIARQCKSPVRYGMHLLLTANPDQIREAVNVWADHRPTKDSDVFVAGLKLFCGKSVGDCSVVDLASQKIVYQTLLDAGYNGVLMTHCEKEEYFSDVWDPAVPLSHAHARPPHAEVESVKDQINLVEEIGFKGTLHIGHISTPEAVRIANEAKKRIKVAMGVTPHHCVLSDASLAGAQGILYKMNPPLRPEPMRAEMLRALLEGKIDWIETDHAPHALYEKMNPPHISGIPGLPYYPVFVSMLRSIGASPALVHRVTYQNIADIFRLPFHQRAAVPSTDLWNEYPLNPYQGISLNVRLRRT
ncbi:dihydroorotase [Candidatus Woesearchaeota archaeon]|nr:dihydroorotase [Candidatus Woesearchaeota archaeon]